MKVLNPDGLLKEMVSFPSLSGNEKSLVDWLEEYIRSTGLLDMERHGDNLIFHLGEGRPWLLMNSHTDVVPPASDHVGEPFDPVIRDGRMYGRGTTDAKGCGSTMLTSLLQLADEGYKPEGRASLALTVCEETGGKGNGMAALRKIIEKPDAAVIGEPTSLEPCLAQKGLLIIRLVTKGETGHAARVTGQNAIYEMAVALEDLKKCRFEKQNSFLGGVKITPTQISGGTAHNVAPSRAELVVDVRTIPDISNDAILDEIRSKVNADVEVISDRYVATGTDPESRIAKAAREASGKPFFGSPTSSDWVFLADVPAIKLGPGHSQLSHTKEENIEIDQLVKGVAIYKQLVKEFFK